MSGCRPVGTGESASAPWCTLILLLCAQTLESRGGAFLNPLSLNPPRARPWQRCNVVARAQDDPRSGCESAGIRVDHRTCQGSTRYARNVAPSEPAPPAESAGATAFTGGEDVEAKFLAAWNVFAATCAQFLAPEPTYQAWFAHYLISQFGIDRVAREPMVKKEHFTDTPWKAQVKGNHVRLDVVVMRTPGVHLPHYVNRLDVSPDGTGLLRLRQMAVISELKVTATQGEGQDHTEVARDAYKLSMLLDELETRGAPSIDLPLAYLCILDNHPFKTYSRSSLEQRFQRLAPDPRVTILLADQVRVPIDPNWRPRRSISGRALPDPAN